MAKICTSCEFCDRKPAEVAPGRMAMMAICTHRECVEPVEGNHLPCSVVRTNEAFCGMSGKYWAKKKEEPKEEKGNIVTL